MHWTYFVSVTWHQPNDFINLNLSTPPGYTYIQRPRLSGKGGGLAVIYRDKLSVTEITVPCVSSFECVAFKINGISPVLIVFIYRPPKPNSLFFNELSELLTSVSSVCSSMILTGDINIHVDNFNNNLTVEFMEVLDCFNMTQHVKFPTHNKGHTLDLVCSVGVDIDQLDSSDLCISDHKLLTFNLNIPSLRNAQKRVISFRNVKNIHFDSLSCMISEHSAVETVDHYNSILSSALDTVAPRRERVVSFVKSSPWYTTELRALKVKSRQLERHYKKSGLTVHKLMYDDFLCQYAEALKTARTEYYSSVIRDGAANPNKIFKTINKILAPIKPSICSSVQECNTFNTKNCKHLQVYQSATLLRNS